MEAAAYEYFARIDELGGMVEAIKHGFPQREIADAAFRYQREVDSRQRIVVGVNALPARGRDGDRDPPPRPGGGAQAGRAARGDPGGPRLRRRRGRARRASPRRRRGREPDRAAHRRGTGARDRGRDGRRAPGGLRDLYRAPAILIASASASGRREVLIASAIADVAVCAPERRTLRTSSVARRRRRRASSAAFRLDRRGDRGGHRGGRRAASRSRSARSGTLCVIDVMMPKLDGYEVTERLRADDELAEMPISC